MADEEVAPVDNEAVRLREELEATHTQLARLEGEAADASAEAASLQTALAEAEARAAAATSELGQLRERADEAERRERDAAARYRALTLRAEPALPADMIAGDTVDAIDASVAAAREIVARVRSHIETETSASRVPAGAPQRTAPDLSAMTPQQKIRHGLEQRAQA